MKCSGDQLAQKLNAKLGAIYFISGDEPLLCQEASLKIKQKASSQGFVERYLFVVDKGFDWDQLKYEFQNQSLFESKKVIELRFNSNKIGDKGSAAIVELLNCENADTLVIIEGPKLDSAAQRSKWVKALISEALVVQIWPIDIVRFPQWIQTRAQAKGLELSSVALEIIVERVEGNLLAASQELDKLFLLNGAGRVDDETVKQSITDSAKFSVYSLVDNCLAANAHKLVHVLEGLKTEGIDPILVLWALTREIRSLTQMAQKCIDGASIEAVLTEYRVWEKRKPLIRGALTRYALNQWFQILAECEKIDRQVKGLESSNVWDSLLRLSLVLSGNILFYPKQVKATKSRDKHVSS